MPEKDWCKAKPQHEGQLLQTKYTALSGLQGGSRPPATGFFLKTSFKPWAKYKLFLLHPL